MGRLYRGLDMWHEHAWLAGSAPTLDALTLALPVPLLSPPQAVHYVLDGS
jgi:hypothetical protein